MTIGPDGKPKIREFGNVMASTWGRFGGGRGTTRSEISGETEPLVDITTTDKEIKFVVEMPGISKTILR